MFGSRWERYLFFFFLSFGEEGCCFFLTGEAARAWVVLAFTAGAGAGAATSIFTGAEVTASSSSAVGVAAGVLGLDGAAVGEGLPRQWELPAPLPESPRGVAAWQGRGGGWDGARRHEEPRMAAAVLIFCDSGTRSRWERRGNRFLLGCIR